ncbi:MAG: hypothetical protein O8C67_09615, partial [Candidatus Methanoperedens sp.]|nr:hypothetical protein [Candidatus Methanoperedens sp.]
ISGIIIFAIAGFVFMAGYQAIQETNSKFVPFSSEKYQMDKTMESTGGIVAIIGLLVAMACIVEKDK